MAVGDLRRVYLPVEVLIEWSDKIIADYDIETDTILEYTSGFVMRVLPNQTFPHQGEKTAFIANTTPELP